MALKVLLADDSVPALNMGKKILIDAGYDVMTVANGLEAMRKIKDIAPDVAILDIFMPGYSGLEVCRFLRADDKTAGLPVILTVGKLEPYRPEDGEGVRSNAVLVKPFAADELTSAVRSLAGASNDDADAAEDEDVAEAAEPEQATQAEPEAQVEVEAPTAEAVTQEAAASDVAPTEATPTEAAATEDTAAKAAAAAAIPQDDASQDDEDDLPVTYQSTPELLDATLNRFSSDNVEIGLGASGRFASDPEARSTGGAMSTSGANQSRFEASVFDTIAPDLPAPEDGQTSVFSLDQSALNEFEITPEPLLAALTTEPEAAEKSWYASDEIDSRMDNSANAEAAETEPLLLAETDEDGAAPTAAFEPASSNAEAVVLEELTVESAPASDPLEVIELDAPVQASVEAVPKESLEKAVDIELGAGADEAVPQEAAQDVVDAAQAEAGPALEGQAEADPVPLDEDARREAFEALFNSDIPFPLQNASQANSSEDNLKVDSEAAPEANLEAASHVEAAEPLELESEPSLQAAEPVASDVEEVQPCSGEEETAAAPAEALLAEEVLDEGEEKAAALLSSDALAEVEPTDEPFFYTAELEAGLLETTAAENDSSSDEAVERTELVAEVAKVGALLEQMQAMRQAETDPQAESALEDTAEEETLPPLDPVAAEASECMMEPAAEASTEGEGASLQTGSEVEAFLPSPVAAQSEQGPVAEPEAALAEALAEEAATLAADKPGSDSNAAQKGRIQGAVEKVFERFRPLLVAAIAEELRRRD